MAWKATGAERGKSYKVYQDLEAAYNKVRKERDDLEALLRVKDSTIRMLAAELASVPGSDQAHKEAVKATIEAVERLSELRATSTHDRPPSEVPVRPSEVVRRGVPLSEQLSQKKAGSR